MTSSSVFKFSSHLSIHMSSTWSHSYTYDGMEFISTYPSTASSDFLIAVCSESWLNTNTAVKIHIKCNTIGSELYDATHRVCYFPSPFQLRITSAAVHTKLASGSDKRYWSNKLMSLYLHSGWLFGSNLQRLASIQPHTSPAHLNFSKQCRSPGNTHISLMILRNFDTIQGYS